MNHADKQRKQYNSNEKDNDVSLSPGLSEWHGPKILSILERLSKLFWKGQEFRNNRVRPHQFECTVILNATFCFCSCCELAGLKRGLHSDKIVGSLMTSVPETMQLTHTHSCACTHTPLWQRNSLLLCSPLFLESLWLSVVCVRSPPSLFPWPVKFLGASLYSSDSECLVVAFVLNGAVGDGLKK